MGLHRRIKSLYGDGQLQLSADELPDTSGIEAAFGKAMEWLHGKRLFEAEMLREKPVRELMDETTAYLSKGIERGIQTEPPSEAMVESLRESAGVFSGFKTFHEMKEAASMLVDADGNLKTFEQFSNDVQKINAAYNQNYLRTEYNFTVQSALAAANWEEQQDDGDGRYLLQYRTAGDEKVRESHRRLDGITLPKDDPFWDKYYPPNGFGCRCGVVQVRASKYPASDSKAAMDSGDEATAGKHAEMFRFNPGKQRAAYPAYNSYTISKCATCTKNGLQLANASSNELCSACQVIHSLVERETTKRLGRRERKAILDATNKWADTHLPEVTLPDGNQAKRLYLEVKGNSHTVIINKAFFKETHNNNLGNSRLAETMELATKVQQWLPKARFIRNENGIDHDFRFNVYEVDFNGVTIECKAKLTEGEILYNMRIKE